MRVVMHIALVFRKSKHETVRERYSKELDFEAFCSITNCG